jgi:hypothetical protein
MKLRLNVEELNDDFFEDTRLLGITAPVKNYQFCLQLNNHLGYDFRLNTDFEIQLRKKERIYYFSLYQSLEPNSFLVHYLYHNQFDGEYLDDEKCNWIKQAVKNLNGVQLVAELTNEQIKNKGNMVF